MGFEDPNSGTMSPLRCRLKSLPLSTNAIFLSWPATIPSLGLQQISGLTQTNWSAATNAAATTNGLVQAVVGGSLVRLSSAAVQILQKNCYVFLRAAVYRQEMTMQSGDWQLLDEYARRNSEEAFRALADRYSGLVYHAALRQLGNPHAAQEVTQAVFIALARKAGSIPRGTVLPGWMFRATRYAVSNLAREEARRQRCEQESVMMETTLRSDETDSAWEQISPHLNDALCKLSDPDREAVLIRFFQDKSHKEVAVALGISEDAAKMRVSRALEKLRSFFAKQGFAVPSAVLLAALTAHSVQACCFGKRADLQKSRESGRNWRARRVNQPEPEPGMLCR